MNTHTLTRRIRSPEDIEVGDFIVKTHKRYQLVPCNAERPMSGEAIEPVILYGWPFDAGEPLKVLALCLPFVMVESLTYGVREAIDTRQDVLMKVSKAYAKAAKPKPEKKKKKKKGKSKKRK
jgi:hypothetical protein